MNVVPDSVTVLARSGHAALDELGELGFDVDEPEEVDVLAVARSDERQQLVGNLAALAA